MKVLAIILALKLAGGVPVGSDWHATWRLFDVDPAIAESVVWPEMQLYCGMRDKLEASADYDSYVSGIGNFDFSIGIFQMKPSFVEKLENAWMDSGFADFYDLRFDVSDGASARGARLSRMGSGSWQVIYLAMFMRLLYRSYGSFDDTGARLQEGIESLPVEDQVRLSATAYNRGCAWTDAGCGSIEALRAHSDVVSFPRVIIRTSATRQYCYATLAWEHYQTIAGKQ